MIIVFTCIFNQKHLKKIVPTPNFWTVMCIYTNHILTAIKNEQKKKINFI